MTRLNGMALLCALALASCGGGKSAGPDASVPPCETLKCGTACCALGDVCYKDACCAPVACGDKECGDDGCGTSCGICGSGWICNLTTSKCVVCQPESDTDFCTRLKKQCGTVTAPDNCGDSRTVAECGPCSNGKGCAADDTCTGACEPQSRDQFCAAGGKNCGSYNATDNCLQDRTENCGVCPNGGDCIDNVCPCAPEDDVAFCDRMARLGKVCGVVADEDNCGGTRTADCGTDACAAGSQSCVAATNKCADCVGETEAALCLASGIECGSFTTTDKCGASRTPDCGACSGAGLFCSQNVCMKSGAPVNDKCVGAQDLSNATGPVNGTTTGATDDSQGSCATAGVPLDGPDVVYKLTIVAGQEKSALITVTATGFQPALYLRKVCTSAAPADELACSASTGGSSAQLSVNKLAAGTWYLIVDGESAGSGDFQLSVVLAAPINIPDDCSNPEVLSVVSNVATTTGDTSRGRDDTASSTCGGQGAPDLVYELDLAADQDVRIDVTPTSASGLVPVVSLRSACNDVATEKKCVAVDEYSGGTATLHLYDLPQGTWYIWVDSDSGYDEGAFTLTATLSPPTLPPGNDKCSGATPLAFTGKTASASGDTGPAANDYAIACSASGSPNDGGDVVYSLNIPAASGNQSISARVIPDATATDYEPAVYIQKACGSTSAGDTLACGTGQAGSAAAATVLSAAPGDYFVIVDGQDQTGGLYSLQVTVDAPIILPDDCNTVQALDTSTLDAQGDGTLVLQGDTTLANDTMQGSCGGDAPDLVYSLTTTDEKDVSVTLAFDDPMQSATVYVRQGACASTAATDELGCYSSYDSTVGLSLRRLPAGTYFIWADGSYGSMGTFTLTVKVSDFTPAPPGDTCAADGTGAVPLALGVSQSGDTSAAGDDYGDDVTGSTSCGNALWSDAAGPEVVYSYQPATSGPFTVTVTPQGWDVVLWMTTGTCGGDGTSCVDASDQGYEGDAEYLTETGVAGTTYFFYVDAKSGYDYGPFTIEVQ